jgi:DNA phosphorothioation-dependent restriction protein DptG
MKKIELLRTGIDGLEERYSKSGSFAHKPGKQIKLMPFNTSTSIGTTADFSSFQGIVGECFRISNNKIFDKSFTSNKEESFKKKLKNHILSEVIEKVETDKVDAFKDIVISLFFEEDGELIKFNRQVLPFMNFINSNSQLKETARYLFDIFLDSETLNDENLIKSSNDNLYYQLVLESLPELKNSNVTAPKLNYTNLFSDIKKLFLEDFKFLASNEQSFLKHLEDLFRYYYFFYLTQLAHRLNSIGTNNSPKHIYFSMDWEVLSESRPAYHTGWKNLSYDLKGLWAHTNAIEMLNYISVNGESVGDYKQIIDLHSDMEAKEQEKLIIKVREISDFYISNIPDLYTGASWDKCDAETKGFIERNNTQFSDTISKELLSFFRRVNYQFINTGRNAASGRYEKWLFEFCKANYTKTRGRLGATTVLRQETLLFLTKLCVGNESKIRLKTLWDKLEIRGLMFDEASKVEIIKLFERINLLEKKSDSGDAQYVKSII